MNETTKNKLIILAVMFVLLSSWVIGNFLYIMINSSNDSGAPIISTDKIRRGLEGESDSSSIFNILFAVFIITVIILLSVAIIGFLFESDLALLTQISVIIVVILVTTTLFTLNTSEPDDNLNRTIPDSGEFNIPGGRNILEKTSPYGHIIFPVILLCISFLLFSELKQRKKDTEFIGDFGFDEEEERYQMKENISTGFEEIRNELTKGDKVREAIINAYLKMIWIFEQEGIDFEPSMTSREFMNYAMKNLEVSDETISDITDLFEEARYSSHSLDELYREQILNDLKRLEEELKD